MSLMFSPTKAMKLAALAICLSGFVVCAEQPKEETVPAEGAGTVPTTEVAATNTNPVATSNDLLLEGKILDVLAVAKKTGTNEVNLSVPLATPYRTNVSEAVTTDQAKATSDMQIQLDLARSMRREKDFSLATKTLAGIMEANVPMEFKRLALFELGLVACDAGQFLKAQQVFSQYIQLYADDPSVPDVLLRQGLMFRQMGVNTLAISKFYAVMSSSLKLKLDNLEYYKKLVEQAQIEIADTYYIQGKYAEAADFFGRLAKSKTLYSDQSSIHYKLVRSLSYLPDQADTISYSQKFLEQKPLSSEVPEVRFILASALKSLGRNQDSMKQVLLLLQSQEENVKRNPETWVYWQQKAGNSIASQLYREGDYINALEIYLSLADLDKSPAWQVPVWYQTGLIFEQLQQPEKAMEIFGRIEGRRKELTPATATQSLLSIFDMAKWRKDYVAWMEKTRMTNKAFQRSEKTNQVAVATP